MSSKTKIILVLVTQCTCVFASKHVYYRENQPFTLDCNIKDHYSIKNTTYSWLKKGTIWLNESTEDIIWKEGGAIEFIKPQDYQQGSYQCFAKTMWGTASSIIYDVFKTTIEYEKQMISHTAFEGKPYQIQCPTPKGFPRPEVYWVTQANGSDVRNKLKGPRNIQGPIETENTLFFREVTKDDLNIKYLCLANSPAVDESVVLGEHSFEEVSPGDGSNGTPVLQYISEDTVKYVTSLEDFFEQAKLYCLYSGKKLPKRPTWYKGDQKLSDKVVDRVAHAASSGGHVLLIRNVKYSDAGTYTCEVDIDGNKVNHTLKLTVVGPPIFVTRFNPLETIAGNCSDYTARCHVAGNTIPTVKWIYNAQPLEESDKFVIKREVREENVAVSELTIKNVQLKDQGYYGCRADNDQGYEYQETLVYVTSE